MGIRNYRTVLVILTVVLLGWGVGSAGLNGQIGGFIKKRVKDVVKDPAKSSEPAAEQSGNNATPRFNENVLELKEETLAKLEKALISEKDLRAAIEAKYAKLPTSEQYDQCMLNVMMSPEAQTISKGTDVSQMMTKLAALQESKCGKNPSRTAEGKNGELRQTREQGAKSAGLTLTQYSIASERIQPFCSSGGQDRVRGMGNLYYVYTASEMNAIKPKCSRLTSLISDLNSPPKK